VRNSVGTTEDIADLQLREAQQGKRLIERQIESEVRNLYRDIRNQQQVVKDKEIAAEVATERYRNVLRKYHEDMATRLEMLTAHAERISAEAEYLGEVYTHEMLKYEFHHSYSKGSSADLDDAGDMDSPTQGGIEGGF